MKNFFAIIGVIASIIAILIFLTGNKYLKDFFAPSKDVPKDTTEVQKIENIAPTVEEEKISESLACEKKYTKADNTIGCLFTYDEVDLFCDKYTFDTFIFHGKKVNYSLIDYVVFDPFSNKVFIHLLNGDVLDLGVETQYLVKPCFLKTEMVKIVRTENKDPIEGRVFKLYKKGENDSVAKEESGINSYSSGFESKIPLYFHEEDSRKFERIYSYFASNMERYYDLYNPSFNELKETYEASWEKFKVTINKVESIEKIDSRTYNVKLNFKYHNESLNKLIEKETHVRIIFNSKGKISSIYSIGTN